MSVDEYHSELETIFKFNAQQASAMEKARNGGSTAEGRATVKNRQTSNNTANSGNKAPTASVNETPNRNTTPNEKTAPRVNKIDPTEPKSDGKTRFTAAGLPKAPRKPAKK